MALNRALLAELEQEAKTTRKLLERVPEQKFSWQPHEKSMSLGRLATHVAEMMGWLEATLNLNELDLAGDYQPVVANTNKELVALFDKNLARCVELLNKATDEQLHQPWRLRKGDHVLFELPKIAVIRSMVFNHVIHHRGQLSVYLRLLDVPLPSIYGPTADEPMM